MEEMAAIVKRGEYRGQEAWCESHHSGKNGTGQKKQWARQGLLCLSNV